LSCCHLQRNDLADLNRVRVKNLVLNGIMTTPPPPTIFVDDVGFRVLEQELELQLSLLKEHTPEPSLFPDASEDSAIGMALPHLNDPTPSDAVVDSSKDMHVSAGSASIKLTPSMTLKDTIMDENVLEPLMICMAIVGLALMPQLVM
jgi:hypothetical protein